MLQLFVAVYQLSVGMYGTTNTAAWIAVGIEAVMAILINSFMKMHMKQEESERGAS